MDDKRKLTQGIFNPVSDSVQKLAQLFPSAVKDGEVDFNALKEELGQFTSVGAEKYELNWAGKANAKRVAREDVLGRTLNYVPQDSKNADTTENLYIEGDNLEVLKLLHQNYYGAIKMIYIDPPYNTGNDFVYRDNFAMSEAESAEAEGETIDGERMVVNQKSTNRYHANWLNMMYPRLKVAKDLLTEDGLIFISINEIEMTNLQKACDELFGEDCHVATFVWKNKYGPGALTRGVASLHEYILCYGKQYPSNVEAPLSEEEIQKYKQIDDKFSVRGGYITQPLATKSKDDRPNLVYPLTHNGIDIWPDKQWIWSKDRLYTAYNNDGIVINENNGKYSVRFKQYLRDENGIMRKGKPLSLIMSPFNQNGTKEIADLLGERIFDFPKPIDLIKYFLSFVINEFQDQSFTVLDFFSGSATAAHAVMQLNAEDGGNRKFIMVQVPEVCDDTSEAYKAGYKNICEIGKERIRRAGEKIKADIEEQNAQLKLGEDPKQVPDIGFKVFRTADTNIRWTHEALKSGAITIDESMLSEKDKLDFMPGFKDIDVVYEVLLRQRDVPLSAKVECRNEIGKRTYLIADAYLVCLEESITKDMLEKLAAVEPLPIKYILRDSAFEDNISLKDETIRRLEALIARNAGEQERTYTVEFI